MELLQNYITFEIATLTNKEVDFIIEDNQLKIENIYQAWYKN